MRQFPFPLPLLLDGSTGVMLSAAGMPEGVCTEQWVLEIQTYSKKFSAVMSRRAPRSLRADLLRQSREVGRLWAGRARRGDEPCSGSALARSRRRGYPRRGRHDVTGTFFKTIR